MTKSQAQFVRAGDMLIGPAVGITKPTQVLEVRTEDSDPNTRLPLFVMDGERFPITYSLLDRPECRMFKRQAD